MKADIAEIKSEQAIMKADIAEIKSEQAIMKADIAEIKSEQAIMKADIAEIKSEQAIMKADIAEIKSEQAIMKADIAEIKSEQAIMKADIAKLQRDMTALQRDMGVMKGWQTELVVERRARSVFRRLCGGHLLRIYPDIELQHYIGYNRHAGRLTEEEFNQAGSIDFLLEGTDSGGAAVIYAVEVSYTMGIDDSDRAIDKAGLLTAALDRKVRSAVVGESSTAQFESDAVRRKVAYAYIGNGRSIAR